MVMADTTPSSTATPTSPFQDAGLFLTALGALHGAAVNAAFFCFDVCLATAFVLFSKPSHRRSALFLLHLLSFICAGAFFVIQIAEQPLQIYEHASQKPDGTFDRDISLDLARWVTAGDFLSVFTPMLTQFSLFFKLSAMFPSWRTSHTKRCLVLGPFVTVLVIRLVVVIITAWADVSYTILQLQPGESVNSAIEREAKIGTILDFVDFGLQILSGTYVSVLILLRTHQYRKQKRAGSRNAGLAEEKRLWRKLNFFVESIFMSFLPPILCQILFLATFDINNYTLQGISTYASTANVLLSVSCSVLATTWSTLRDNLPRRSSSTRDHRRSLRNFQSPPSERAEPEVSIIGALLERSARIANEDDADNEDDIEYVGTTSLPADEAKSTPALPRKGTSEWRTHLSRPPNFN